MTSGRSKHANNKHSTEKTKASKNKPTKVASAKQTKPAKEKSLTSDTPIGSIRADASPPTLVQKLNRILHLANSQEQSQAFFASITFKLATLLSARLVMLFLSKNSQGFYQLMHHTQLTNTYPVADTLEIRFGEGLIGEIGERAEMISLPQIDASKPLSDHPSLAAHNYGCLLGLPLMRHGNLLGILTIQRSAEDPFSEDETAALVTFAAQLAHSLQQHHDLSSIDKEAVKRSRKSQQETTIEGIPSSPGIALGKAVVVYPPADLSAVPFRNSNNPEQEWEGMRAALSGARKEFKRIHQQAQEHLPPAEQALFEVYIQMLDSRSLSNEIKQEIIKQHQWAQGALRRVIERHLQQMEQFEDAYLRDRADDLRDLGNRILAHLQHSHQPEISRPKKYILVSEDVTASILLEASPKEIVGIISGTGSSNSHVAILARALQIPAITGIKDRILTQLDGRSLAVDGYAGSVYLEPSRLAKQEFKTLVAQEQSFEDALKKSASLPTITLDKHHVVLQVNTGLASDTQQSLQVGAEGSGLFRTEIPFMMRDRFPSEEEQQLIYQETLQAFAPEQVTMRTLDVGGDKSLPYFKIQEDNPFLGWRGIRITLDHPEIFLQQIRAMLKASIGINNLNIMLPMVISISEAETSIALIRQAYDEVCIEHKENPPRFPRLGLMIETPSAIYLAYELARRVDFISVGSNDLIQYLLAVDRNNPRVAKLYDGLHPAILRALQHCVKAAHRARRKAAICGELAADPLAAVLLVGMGYDSLSMNASSLPRIKWIIRHMTLEKAQQLTKEVLNMDDPVEIRCHMEIALDELGLGGLIRAGHA